MKAKGWKIILYYFHGNKTVKSHSQGCGLRKKVRTWCCACHGWGSYFVFALLLPYRFEINVLNVYWYSFVRDTFLAIEWTTFSVTGEVDTKAFYFLLYGLATTSSWDLCNGRPFFCLTLLCLPSLPRWYLPFSWRKQQRQRQQLIALLQTQTHTHTPTQHTFLRFPMDLTYWPQPLILSLISVPKPGSHISFVTLCIFLNFRVSQFPHLSNWVNLLQLLW